MSCTYDGNHIIFLSYPPFYSWAQAQHRGIYLNWYEKAVSLESILTAVNLRWKQNNKVFGATFQVFKVRIWYWKNSFF